MIFRNFQLTIRKTFFIAFSLLLVYGISYLVLKGIGAPRSFFPTIILVFAITLCSASKKSFWLLVFPFMTINALYSPIGFTYGSLTYDFLIAGFATDTLEIKEFLHQIPYQNYLLPFIIISGLFLYRKTTTLYNIQYFKNRSFLIIAIIIMIATQSPTHFIRNLKTSAQTIYQEQQILINSTLAQTWGKSSLHNSKYDNYILIIGESARKDYHHAYGYPINNTPFMSSTNGLLIDGLTSGGSSTVPSLKAMLTLSNKKTWDADYTKTIIGLAKSAEIKTYWLSNQGYFGTYDTPISAIANSSDESYFLKYADYSSLNTSDFELLNTFEKIINDNITTKKLVVIHLYGSHPNACDRIQDYHLIHEVKDDYYSYLNCYISSIHKTDKLLESINKFMIKSSTQNNSSFSMLYFADHGMAHREINNVLYFNNNKVSKFHYDVPLFMTSSDSKIPKKCKSFKSGLNFTNGIANWIGVRNKFLDPNYSLFDCQSDPNDFGLRQKIKNIEPDYPIDLRNK